MIIKSGEYAGKSFMLDGELSAVFGSDKRYGPKDLNYLVMMSHISAVEAKSRGYTSSDAPFYYGSISGFGYILSHKDLYGDSNE
jgi:hypothetical protein